MNILISSDADESFSDWMVKLSESRVCSSLLMVIDIKGIETALYSGIRFEVIILSKQQSTEKLSLEINHIRSIPNGETRLELLVISDPLHPNCPDELRRLGVKEVSRPEDMFHMLESKKQNDQYNIQHSDGRLNDPILDDGHKRRLTPRQVEVLALVNQGKSNKQIARDLDLTEGTVKVHCKAIFRALGVVNRTQAAVLLAKANLNQPYSF